ncbi:hypothetical protein WDU94_000325 [Cyamophila willieti]
MLDYDTFFNFVQSMAKDILDYVNKEIELNKKLTPEEPPQPIRVDVKEDEEEGQETEEELDVEETEDEGGEASETSSVEVPLEDKVKKPKYDLLDIKEHAEKLLATLNKYYFDSLDLQKDIGIVDIYEELTEQMVNLGFYKLYYWSKMNCYAKQDCALQLKAKKQAFIEFFDMKEKTMELLKTMDIWPKIHFTVNKEETHGYYSRRDQSKISKQTREDLAQDKKYKIMEHELKTIVELQTKDIKTKEELLQNKLRSLEKDKQQPPPVKEQGVNKSLLLLRKEIAILRSDNLRLMYEYMCKNNELDGMLKMYYKYFEIEKPFDVMNVLKDEDEEDNEEKDELLVNEEVADMNVKDEEQNISESDAPLEDMKEQLEEVPAEKIDKESVTDEESFISCSSSSIDWFETKRIYFESVPPIKVGRTDSIDKKDEEAGCKVFEKQQKLTLSKTKGGLTWFSYETKKTPAVKAKFNHLQRKSARAFEDLTYWRKELSKCKVKEDQMRVLCDLQREAVRWETEEYNKHKAHNDIIKYKLNNTSVKKEWPCKFNLIRNKYRTLNTISQEDEYKIESWKYCIGLMRNEKKDMNYVLRKKQKQLAEHCRNVKQNEINRKRLKHWARQLEDEKRFLAKKETESKAKAKADQENKAKEARVECERHSKLMKCLEMQNAEQKIIINDFETDVDCLKQGISLMKQRKDKIHEYLNKQKNDRMGYKKKITTIQKEIVKLQKNKKKERCWKGVLFTVNDRK